MPKARPDILFHGSQSLPFEAEQKVRFLKVPADKTGVMVGIPFFQQIFTHVIVRGFQAQLPFQVYV